MLSRFRVVHGDKYEYEESSFTTTHVPMRIFCKVHKEWFTQIPWNHINGAGCPKCGVESRVEKKTMPFFEAKSLAEKKFGVGIFEFDESSYTNFKGRWLLKCSNPSHEPFEQLVESTLAGFMGCTRCNNNKSGAEFEVLEFIRGLGVSADSRCKLPNSKKELDIFCPDLGIAFEYDGLYWHSEEMGAAPSSHLDKTIEAQNAGIRLIHIFEDEWLYNRDRTKSWIKFILGKESNRVGARTLQVRRLEKQESDIFINAHHMQGAPHGSTYRYGLFNSSGQMLSTMSFGFDSLSPTDRDAKSIELNRFCSSTNVVGAFSKLLVAFIRDHGHEYSKIISFSDMRWSMGGVYSKNGFVLDSISEPRYWYVLGNRRFHRREFQRQYLEKKLSKFDPNLTERENMKSNGYLRIWDCGKAKWVYNLT